MKILVDTHSHTIVSGHAYSSMKEMAHAANEKGLEALAITEHAPSMPGTCGLFYFENLKVVPHEIENIRIFHGVELNILDSNGTVDLYDNLLERLDLVIASIHPPCFLSNPTQDDIMKAYLCAMQNPHIDIIGHPDDGRYPVDYDILVKGAKATNTLLEVNNSSLSQNSFRLNAWENIMKMLFYCKKYCVPITTGSDSHVDVDAGNFTHILEILKAAEFPSELVITSSLSLFQQHIKHNIL